MVKPVSIQTWKSCLEFFVPAEISLVLLQGLKEGLAFVRGSADESVQISETPVQHMDLFHTCGRLMFKMAYIWLASALVPC